MQETKWVFIGKGKRASIEIAIHTQNYIRKWPQEYCENIFIGHEIFNGKFHRYPYTYFDAEFVFGRRDFKLV